MIFFPLPSHDRPGTRDRPGKSPTIPGLPLATALSSSMYLSDCSGCSLVTPIWMSVMLFATWSSRSAATSALVRGGDSANFWFREFIVFIMLRREEKAACRLPSKSLMDSIKARPAAVISFSCTGVGQTLLRTGFLGIIFYNKTSPFLPKTTLIFFAA